jgi:hypothetical protein
MMTLCDEVTEEENFKVKLFLKHDYFSPNYHNSWEKAF